MYIKNLSEKLEIRISKELLGRLQNISDRRSMKLSELIRYILAEYVRKNT